MQFLDKVVDEPVVFLGSLAVGAVQLLDKAADVPVVVPQLLSWWSMTLLCRSSLGFVQFLDMVVDMPVVVQIFDKVADVLVVQARRCPDVQKTVVFRSCSSWTRWTCPLL